MDPPGFGEHGAEGQGEAGHQEPRPRRADVRKGRDARQLRVQAEKDDAAVRQHAADDYEVVQVRRRHLYVPESRGFRSSEKCP